MFVKQQGMRTKSCPEEHDPRMGLPNVATFVAVSRREWYLSVLFKVRKINNTPLSSSIHSQLFYSFGKTSLRIPQPTTLMTQMKATYNAKLPPSDVLINTGLEPAQRASYRVALSLSSTLSSSLPLLTMQRTETQAGRGLLMRIFQRELANTVMISVPGRKTPFNTSRKPPSIFISHDRRQHLISLQVASWKGTIYRSAVIHRPSGLPKNGLQFCSWCFLCAFPGVNDPFVSAPLRTECGKT